MIVWLLLVTMEGVDPAGYTNFYLTKPECVHVAALVPEIYEPFDGKIKCIQKKVPKDCEDIMKRWFQVAIIPLNFGVSSTTLFGVCSERLGGKTESSVPNSNQ